MISSVTSTSLSAIHQAMAQLGTAASSMDGSVESITEGAVAMSQASAQVEASLMVLRTANEMVGTLLDIQA